MKIDVINVGFLNENCYVLTVNDKVIVIDPGDDFDNIDKFLIGKKVCGVLITHRHFDHIGALDMIIDKYNTKYYDKSNLEEKEYNIDGFCFEVIYTPGHKEDSLTFYFPLYNVMFTGDFIFKNAIGRCDLKGGNITDMRNSLIKMKKYDRDILVYPGHGNKTFLGVELDNNIDYI